MTDLPAPDRHATCLITGASSGIGAAIARRLAAGGYGVTLVARRRKPLTALAGELADTYGIRAQALPCDLADAAAREDLVIQTRALRLRVDVLVNNAGLASYGRFAVADRMRELSQIQVMCEALVDLCAAFVPGMAARQKGAILIVSSASGFQPAARYATYGAAKAFSLAFGEALHTELKGAGVSVTTICPGPVETDFFAVNRARPVGIPRAMWQSPEAVAAAAVTGLARNRRIVIPGKGMRALIAGSRLSPRTLQLRVMEHLLHDGSASHAS